MCVVPTHKHVANVCVRVSRGYHATVHAGEEHGLRLIRATFNIRTDIERSDWIKYVYLVTQFVFKLSMCQFFGHKPKCLMGYDEIVKVSLSLFLMENNVNMQGIENLIYFNNLQGNLK